MKIFPFKVSYPNPSLKDHLLTEYFSSVKSKFDYYRDNTLLQSEEQDLYYLYSIHTADKTYHGILCLTDINELEHNVLRHENTIRSKEKITEEHLQNRKAMLKPVLLTYEENLGLNEIIQENLTTDSIIYSVAVNAEKHVLRSFSSVMTKLIGDLFAKHIKVAYIADGHHRCSTQLKSYQSKKKKTLNFSKILTLFFSIESVDLRSYNRILKLPGFIDHNKFYNELRKIFVLTKLDNFKRPQHARQFIMLTKENVYSLEVRQVILQSHSKNELLDVGLFNRHILQSILQYSDKDVDEKVKFVSGVEGYRFYKSILDKNDRYYGFMFYPVSKKELMQKSIANEILPAKSTWFEPRLVNGFSMYRFPRS